MLPKSARDSLNVPGNEIGDGLFLTAEKKFSRINDTNAFPAVQGASLKSPITL